MTIVPETPTSATISPEAGRYLCAVLYCTLDDDPPIGTGDLAEHLDVSRASVTEMIEKFDDEGLLVHEPYRGVELTDRGERLARELVWRRCVVQQFFETDLGIEMPPTRAFKVGCTLPHDDVERIADRIDEPCQGLCTASTVEECYTLASEAAEISP
ncbi:MAG TPA: metal-dependent transcriptional regulator [Natrialbaceae archaeon]|jgi:DtxR family Mn-dependent transcriptional regulator|nr:metal-dependent transcriptional regulator [Natrialbaceae archaeon]